MNVQPRLQTGSCHSCLLQVTLDRRHDGAHPPSQREGGLAFLMQRLPLTGNISSGLQGAVEVLLSGGPLHGVPCALRPSCSWADQHKDPHLRTASSYFISWPCFLKLRIRVNGPVCPKRMHEARCMLSWLLTMSDAPGLPGQTPGACCQPGACSPNRTSLDPHTRPHAHRGHSVQKSFTMGTP